MKIAFPRERDILIFGQLRLETKSLKVELARNISNFYLSSFDSFFSLEEIRVRFLLWGVFRLERVADARHPGDRMKRVKGEEFTRS